MSGNLDNYLKLSLIFIVLTTIIIIQSLFYDCYGIMILLDVSVNMWSELMNILELLILFNGLDCSLLVKHLMIKNFYSYLVILRHHLNSLTMTIVSVVDD